MDSGNVIPLPARTTSANQTDKPSDEEFNAFWEWMGGDERFQITVLLRITRVNLYDCGYPTHEAGKDVILLGGYEINAQGDADSSGNLQCMNLYFSSESREQVDAVMALLAVGNIVLVKGYYSLLLDDEPPSFTVFVDKVENIRAVPAQFLPAAIHWLAPKPDPLVI